MQSMFEKLSVLPHYTVAVTVSVIIYSRILLKFDLFTWSTFGVLEFKIANNFKKIQLLKYKSNEYVF